MSKPCVSIGKNRLTENFIKIDQSNSNTDNIKIKKLKETSKKIDRGMVVKGTSKLLSLAINEVANKNISELNKFITMSNSFEIGKVKTFGDFVLTNFKQKVNFDNNVNIIAAQKMKNKIINEIEKIIRIKIKYVVKYVTDNKNSFKESSNVSTSVGDMAESMFSKIADAMVMSFDGSTSGYASTEETKSVKDSLELDDTFTVIKNHEVTDKIQNKLSSENIAFCVSKIKSGNIFKIDTMNVGKIVNIDKFEQLVAIKNVLNCIFNNEVLNDLASKIIYDFEENISRMSESVDKKSIAYIDIQSIGVAGIVILEAVGNGVVSASKDMGEELSKFVERTNKSIDKGVVTPDKGIVGKGIGSMFSNIMIYLIIIGVLIVIVGVLKMSGKI